MNSSQESLGFSSQEVLGPLSQETLANALNTIPKEIFDSFMKNNFDANLSSMEDIVEDSEMSDPKEHDEPVASLQSPEIENSHIQSSIPVTENLPGCYNFTVLTVPEDISKKCKYTFSPVINKLYVEKNVLCPFRFSTSELLDGFVIRAMLYFTYPENRCIVVSQCMHHVKEEGIVSGDPRFKHFIRAESPSSCYSEDPASGRMSVTVNYENPSYGENSTTYLFKFMCYSSCRGGCDRRPMCIVFTLEKNGKLFGRCKIDLKVCSDPKRDRLIDEKHLQKQNSLRVTSNKSSHPMSSLMNNEEIISQIKYKRGEKTDGECFTIKVSNKEEYNYLRSGQKFYHMKKFINSYNWTPSAPEIFLKIFSSSSCESE